MWINTNYAKNNPSNILTKDEKIQAVTINYLKIVNVGLIVGMFSNFNGLKRKHGLAQI